MNKVTIISIIGALLVVAGAVAYSSSTSSISPQLAEVAIASEIVVDRDSHDFGEIDIFAGTVQSDFTLTNTGTEDVTVSKATTSCGCTEGSIAGESFGMHEGLAQSIIIPAGGTEIVTAIYDPLAHGPNATGEITRQLFLTTNSETTSEIELRVSANVFKNE